VSESQNFQSSNSQSSFWLYIMARSVYLRSLTSSGVCHFDVRENWSVLRVKPMNLKVPKHQSNEAMNSAFHLSSWFHPVVI
jgi:hypothetical protein